MDMGMPGVDGWAATRRLKADPKLRHIPVIAVTAHAMQGDREKSLEAGCDDYETKPIDFAQLFEKIERLLAGKSAPRLGNP
jgi:CheY-like chemotaxis protein